MAENEGGNDGDVSISPDVAKSETKGSNVNVLIPTDELADWDEQDFLEYIKKEMDDQSEQLNDFEEASRRWRRRTWMWRIAAFIFGVILGNILPSISSIL